MSSEMAVDLVRETLMAAAIVAVPILAAIGLVSLCVALFQGLTGLSDPTVALVPRLVVGGIVILCLFPWMLERLSEFTLVVYRGALTF